MIKIKVHSCSVVFNQINYHMNQFIGNKWILLYFQALGLHSDSLHKNAYLYKILLILLFLMSYFIAIYFKTFGREYGSITGVVSLLESSIDIIST